MVLVSVSDAWPWAAVAALGAYHGIDPSMGWLFAVALGLQERSRAKVLWSLVPIAIGHLASIAAVVAIIGGLGFFVRFDFLRPPGAAVFLGLWIFCFILRRLDPRRGAVPLYPAY